MRALHYKLQRCKTDVDSLDTYAAFIYRVFDFGGTGKDNYPLEKWEALSLKEMYHYGQFDSGGTFCGQRTKALEKLLKAEGFTDMIEYKIMRWHTFLILRTRNNRAWIADDGYGLWGMMANDKRVDFLEYLRTERINSETVKWFNVPPVFGLPD